MASLQDVAKAAGVSVATVSVVLSNKSHRVGIAKLTREKVRAAAEQLDYRPHLMARGLRTGKTFTIGLLFNSPQELIYAELLAGIQSLLRPYGYAGICAFWEDDAGASEAFQSIHDRGVDAIITSHDDLSLIPADMPTTLLFQHDEVHDSIIIDKHEAMSRVVHHLFDLGHRKLGIVNLNRVTHGPMLMSALGLLSTEVTTFWTYQPELNYLEGTQVCLAEILALPAAQRPTALICRNDTVAILAISEAGRIGLRVPQDISIIGSDAVFLGTFTNPPLTSVGVSLKALAAQAIELTISRLRTLDAPLQNIVLKPKLIERASCAPPNLH